MENIYVHDHTITTKHRNEVYGHKSPVLWFTGLSGVTKIRNSINECNEEWKEMVDESIQQKVVEYLG